MKRILPYLFTLSFLTVCSQELPTIIPPSPEASSLAKFVETPVSYYTGLPSVSIPLVTLSAGNMEIPVSLSYHAKGVQVSEIASRVGTGWTLNAGGSITRQIRQKPDEFGWLTDNYTKHFLTNPSVRFQLMGEDVGLVADFEPDLYLFNFMGFSGKFIMDQDTRLPVLQKVDDITIKPLMSTGSSIINGWEVKDPAGNTYIFGPADRTETVHKFKNTGAGSAGLEDLQNDPALGNLQNSWHLSSIVTVNNDIVYFDYTEEHVTYYDRTGDYIAGGIPSMTYSRTTAYQMQLSKIRTKNAIAYFDPKETQREDFQGGYALDALRLVYRINNTSELSRKNFNFQYEYTTGDDDNVNWALKGNDPIAKKRLFLKSITQTGGNENMVHQFRYNAIVLPSRHSNAQDNWGYYNGQNNGEYMYEIFKKNRTVNTDLSEAGLLKEIIYPTGGSTIFEYENNQLKTPLFYSNIIIPPNNPGVSKDFLMQDANPPFVSTAFIDTFTILGTSVVKVNVDVKYMVSYECTGNCDFTITLFKVNGSGPDTFVENLSYGRQIKELAPGIYKVKVRPSALPYNAAVQPYKVYLDWVEQPVNEQNIIIGLGKRIFRITTKDGGDDLLKKEYTYTDDFGNTTGRLFSIPNYYHKLQYLPGNRVFINGSMGSLSSPLSGYSNGQLGYGKVTETQIGEDSNGKTEYWFTNFADKGKFYNHPYHTPIDFEWVRGMPLLTTTYVFKGNQYKKLRETKNKYIYYNDSYGPYFGIDVLSDPEFSEQPDDLEDQNQMLNYLTSFRKTRIPLFRFGKFSVDHTTNDGHLTDPNWFRISYYISGRVNLHETLTREFMYDEANNLIDEVNTTEKFSYSSMKHHQMTSQSRINSIGETIVTSYNYPPDALMDNEPAIDSLRLKKMINTVLHKTIRTGGFTPISAIITEYKNWGNNIVAPQFVKIKKGLSALETKIQFNGYDNFGNLLEVQKPDGTKISYIWGYRSSLPVAKIENMAYADIPPSLIGHITTAENHNDFVSLLEDLRNDAAIANAMLTTYIYVPLVGPYSITDPKGSILNYSYDSFGRLSQIRDKYNKVLSETEYHYRPVVVQPFNY